MLGSRLAGGGSAIEQGMPWWKYVANRFLTGVENAAFGLRLSEYHTGYRAFSRDVLEAVNFRMNSDGFVFDQEIIAQVVAAGFRIAEIPVPVRYFPGGLLGELRRLLRLRPQDPLGGRALPAPPDRASSAPAGSARSRVATVASGGRRPAADPR